jgi:hypothetical protein
LFVREDRLKKSLRGGSLAALLSLSAPAFAQIHSPPTAGIYSFSPEIKFSGDTCPANIFTRVSQGGFLTFSGRFGRTMDIRLPIGSNAPLSAYISHQALTIREGLGSRRIGGAVHWTVEGINAPFVDTLGSFTAFLVYIGVDSFAISMNEDFPGLSCALRFASPLVLVSPQS